MLSSSLFNRSRNKKATTSGLSEEEKRKRLEEMMTDAKVRDETRHKQVQIDMAKERKEEEEAQMGDPEAPSFLVKMNSKVYGSDEATVEERLRRNVHYRLKGDIEEKGIITKA